VKYTWETELERHELVGAGVVVGKEGVVMAPIALFNIQIPDEQMKDFKIVVPHEEKENDELDAVFLGRDERTSMAFFKTKETQDWKPMRFEDAPLKVGEPLMSVGLLPESAGYKTYFAEAKVSALLRGETPQVLATAGLAAVGSPVFNAEGKAIGLVHFQQNQTPLLNEERVALAAITNPPKFFVPTRDFLQSLSDMPSPEHPITLPWIGVLQLTGVNKDVAEVFGIANQPAIQVGDVIPATPAERAGLKRGDIIVKLNGEALERGDQPEEIPQIFRRKLSRLKPGTEVTFTVLRGKGKPLQDVKVTLEERPKAANQAKRHFFDDLGFSAREMVFADTYARRLPKDAGGVLIALVRPQSAAESGGLHREDVVTDLNGQPVKDLADFQKKYEDLRKNKPHEAVVMVVLREGNTQTIRIEPPQ
jgi:serine protease Do